MADVQVDAGGLKRTLKDLFAGAAGGVAQVLLGQYFHRSAVNESSWSLVGSKKSRSLSRKYIQTFLLCFHLLSHLKTVDEPSRKTFRAQNPLQLLNWPC